jgi:hypothetical protein
MKRAVRREAGAVYRKMERERLASVSALVSADQERPMNRLERRRAAAQERRKFKHQRLAW